jgi:hypothetical protein
MAMAAILSSAGFAAGAEPIELGWRAPSECPSAEAVRAELVDLLGAEHASERVRVDIAVVHEPRGYVAAIVLEVGMHRSERELVAEHCDALADAAALVIAVTVDPAHAVVGDEVVPEPVVVAEPAPPTPTPTPVTTSQQSRATATSIVQKPPPLRPARRRTPGFHARVFGGLDTGATPGPTGTLGAAVGLRGRWFRAELDGSWAFGRERTVPGGAGASARIARGSLAVRGCGVPGRGRIEVPLCAALEAGALVGRGEGATVQPATAVLPWVAFSGGPALAISVVPRVALLIGADVVVPLWRARFEIGDVDAFRPARVGMRALLGVELRWGARP